MAVEKIYEFGSLIVDTVKHEIRKTGLDSKDGRPLPTPRRQIFTALIYLIENRGRAIPLEDLWDASRRDSGDSDAVFSEPAGYKIIEQCRRALDNSRETYIQRIGTGLYRFIHNNVKESPGASKQTLKDTPSSRELDKAVAAWSTVTFPELFDVVVQYYQRKGILPFSYKSKKGKTTSVPLYVRPEWLNLGDASLEMTRDDIARQVALPKEQQQFRNIYPKVRKRLGLKPLWNGPVFRLVKLHSAGSQLKLHFEEGWFFDTLACHWVLEHETRQAIARRKPLSIHPRDLPIRESLASTIEGIERFCETQVARVGVSNLILLRKSEAAYQVLIRARGALSMGAVGNFDTMSSGIFDIATGSPKMDFSLEYKVFKEIYEEVFGNKEVEKEIRHSDLRFFYKKRGMASLRDMLDDGRASFQVTGFCIDLVRMAPEITTVLVVRDDSYYRTHWKKMKANAEYAAGLDCEIPRNLSDVDEYLAEKFPANPARPEAGGGFDPARWTLPGGFCFRQGLNKAVGAGLL